MIGLYQIQVTPEGSEKMTPQKFYDGMKITLKNPFTHPSFVWPDTLLSYPLIYDNSIGISVYNEKGERVNSQLESSKDGEVTLYIKASLSPGEEKNYILKEEKQVISSELKIIHEKDCSILSNGKFSVKIPKDGTECKNPPAPVTGVSRNGKWMGSNTIRSDVSAKISVREKTFGALFAEYDIDYNFIDGKRYSVTLKFTAGYDFIELRESCKDISPEDGIFQEYRWTDFNATHKYMSTWPDDKWLPKSDRYGDYEWRRADENIPHPYYGEDPRFQGGSMLGEDAVGHGCDPIRFAPYVPFFGYSVRPCGAYWDEKTKDSLGIFVNGNDNWDDEEYSIWASSDTLAGKYIYEDDTVVWQLPISSGKRSICLCCYSREMDEEWFSFLNKLKDEYIKMGVNEDEAIKLTRYPTSYTAYLHNRYVTLNLDKVKDMQLTYSGTHPVVDFPDCSLKSAEELYKFILSTGRCAIATKGTEEFHERPYTFEAVEIRTVYDVICDSFLRLHKDLTPEQKKEVDALLLLTAYMCAGEEVIPMMNILGGHPNFLTDVKCIPPLIAFLYPEHRDKDLFLDIFDKFLDLNTRYHTRPEVKKWSLKGGRWTEAIGIYTWAFMGPSALTSAIIRKHLGGKNMMSSEKMVQIAKWIIGLTSAPTEIDGVKQRAMSTQGAHSALRSVPKVLRLLGQQMKTFDPLLADNIYYITKDSPDFIPEANHKHLKWEYLYDDGEKAPFAKPDFVSEKYTGYGSMMRYMPYSDKEMSVHLQQIDLGPNYRWGMANEGGCGSIFYYADGKCWSYNGKEDAGDRRMDDASYATNFGVWKEHRFRSIGQNVLKEPLLALGEVQYHKITSDESFIYSYPEYKSRSVLMMGGDYIVTYDSVSHPNVYTRFSWFVKKEDEYPLIHFVKGITMDRFAVKNYAMSEHITAQSKGKWFEGTGDCMAVVSHKKDLEITNCDFGCIVKGEDFTDYIVNDVKAHTVSYPDGEIKAKVASVRKLKDGTTVISVIDGEYADFKDMTFTADKSSFCITISDNNIFGKVYSNGGGINISGITTPVYIDSEKTSDTTKIADGIHTLEITNTLPTPTKPIISAISGKKVVFTQSVAATEYILEYSTDGKMFKETTEEELFRLENKAVIRIKAKNQDKESEYSNEYPYFPQNGVPDAPSGLKIFEKKATWGKVYGAVGYRLYKEGKNEPVYEGSNRFADTDGEGVYFVTAINEKGESAKSFTYDCQNPILNYYPVTYKDRFTRSYAYLKKPYYTGVLPDLTYPE